MYIIIPGSPSKPLIYSWMRLCYFETQTWNLISGCILKSYGCFFHFTVQHKVRFSYSSKMPL
jgi:hypothetical protein